MDTSDTARAFRERARISMKFGQVEDAVELLRQGSELHPESAETLSDLGYCLCSLGRAEEALAAFARAIRRDRCSAPAWSRLAMTALYSSRLTRQEVYELHLQAGRAISANAYQAGITRRNGTGRIRIGYISADFFNQSVMAQVEPVLRSHDRSRFRIFCYSDTPRHDALTERLKTYDLKWKEIVNLPDKDVASLIHADQLDVLIDLAGHTGQGRLQVLAARVAPVQVSSFGYPNTTGLRAVDYRITDSYADPPGQNEVFYTETLLRIDPCFCCYQPPESPEIKARTSTQHFVFCCFNALPKISPPVLDLWAEVLRAVPDGVLLLKAVEFIEPASRARVLAELEQRGVDRDRLTILPPFPNRAEHLDLYNMTDLALDTLPYSGTITTCEALWMGVPVLTLPGESHVSRVSGSILNTLGLRGCIASSQGDYVAIARHVAAKGKRSTDARRQLRNRMRNSPMMDYRTYTRKFERAMEARVREPH